MKDNICKMDIDKFEKYVFNSEGGINKEFLGRNINRQCIYDPRYGVISLTPLEWAASAGYMKVVKYLIKHLLRRDINISLLRALETAIHNGHIDVVKYLIENGADINCTILEDMGLIMDNNLEIIQWLVENADITKAVSRRMIVYAVNTHQVKVVKYLLGTFIHPEDFIKDLIGDDTKDEIRSLLMNYTQFSNTKACK